MDDSDPKARRINEQIVADFRADSTRTVYLENYRTPGAAGAWNTALSWLQGAEPTAFVAILDDDDAWAPTYPESTEGGRQVSVLKRQEGVPVNLG